MPVRIVFRGLILFRIEGTGTREGKIIAELVDFSRPRPSVPTTALSPTSSSHSSGSSHSTGDPGPGEVEDHHDGGGDKHDPGDPHGRHRHFPEIQVYTSEQRKFKHMELSPGRNINLMAPIERDFVDIHPSYHDHCPKLAKILENADDPAFRNQPWRGTDSDFVSTTVTVNRGTIRVKDVVTWDAGAFPLTRAPQPGFRSATPALVSFLGSSSHGHMASECVIDIDSDEIHMEDDKHGKKEFLGASPANSRAPERTVEVLVTNFPPQQDRALPWSLHFLLLFRAASYVPQKIPSELRKFDQLARYYLSLTIKDPAEIDAVIARELAMLGVDGTGFPIPYLEPKGALTRLEPITAKIVTDPWNLPLCPQGDNSRPFGP